MWLFTRYGFYSVASAQTPEGAPEPATVMVRARCKLHLELLLVRFPGMAMGTSIQTWKDCDYRHRIFVPAEQWAMAVAALAKEQQWSNCKQEVAHFQGAADEDYVQTMHEVWRTMFRLQLAEVPEPVSETTATTTEKPEAGPTAPEQKVERKKRPGRRKAPLVPASLSQRRNIIPMTLRHMKPDPNTYQIIAGTTRLALDLITGVKKQIGPADILDFPPPPAVTPLANSNAQSNPCVDRAERQPGEEVHMPTFSIDRKDSIKVIDNAGVASPRKEVRFHSEKDWEDLVQNWPLTRLVNIWNGIAGTVPVGKFANRKMATARIWKAIQNLEPVARKLPAKREKAAPPVKAIAPVKPATGGSKKDEIIALLSSAAGATLPQLMAATGWQKHSVRGFLSGTLIKKMGLKLSSSKNEAGERLYRVSE